MAKTGANFSIKVVRSRGQVKRDALHLPPDLELFALRGDLHGGAGRASAGTWGARGRGPSAGGLRHDALQGRRESDDVRGSGALVAHETTVSQFLLHISSGTFQQVPKWNMPRGY